jgi:hypothetical protein
MEDPLPEQEGADLDDPVDLGELKLIDGEQSYVIPADIPLELYQSVVIWCVPYEVPFIGAALNAPTAQP